MDSGLNRVLASSTTTHSSFNSIEWILKDWVYKNKLKCDFMSFNSIEWIQVATVEAEHVAVQVPFNSIEWIRPYASRLALYLESLSFQFHWMDSQAELVDVH